MKSNHGIVETGDRLATLIPSQRKTGTMTRMVDVGAVELKGSEPSVSSQMRRRDLIRGNAIVKTLAWLGVAVRAGEPERAPPMSLIRELVRNSLHDREARLVSGEWSQSGRQRVIGTGLLFIWKPSFVGHAPAEIEKHSSFGARSLGVGCSGKAAIAEGLECRQRNQRAGASQESTTGMSGIHANSLGVEGFALHDRVDELA